MFSIIVQSYKKYRSSVIYERYFLFLSAIRLLQFHSSAFPLRLYRSAMFCLNFSACRSTARLIFCASTLLPEARLFFTSHKRWGTSILQLNCLIMLWNLGDEEKDGMQGGCRSPIPRQPCGCEELGETSNAADRFLFAP